MTHHPCEGLSPTHHEVFEACAIGLVAPCSTWSIYKTLAARGLVMLEDGRWRVPLHVHMQWCRWCTENTGGIA
jgi:hypothetical protein